MTIRIGLVGLAAAIAIGATAAGAPAAPTNSLFIPNDHDQLHRHMGGSHYSIVDANLVRRCTDLSSQFNQAIARNPGSAMAKGAMPDYRAGVALCDGGSRTQGIDTLEAALKE